LLIGIETYYEHITAATLSIDYSLSAESNLIELYVDFAELVLRQEVELVLFQFVVFSSVIDRMTSFQSVRIARCLHYWRRIYRLCLNIGIVARDKICIFCGKPSI
jgi:hypothetical protein